MISEDILKPFLKDLPNMTSTSGSSFDFNEYQRNLYIQGVRGQLYNQGFSIDDINNTAFVYDLRVATPKDDFSPLRDVQRDTQSSLLNQQIISNDLDINPVAQKINNTPIATPEVWQLLNNLSSSTPDLSNISGVNSGTYISYPSSSSGNNVLSGVENFINDGLKSITTPFSEFGGSNPLATIGQDIGQGVGGILDGVLTPNVMLLLLGAVIIFKEV
jgi:hypothetical protein